MTIKDMAQEVVEKIVERELAPDIVLDMVGEVLNNEYDIAGIATEHIEEMVKDLDPDDAICSAIQDNLDLDDKIEKYLAARVDELLEAAIDELDLDEMIQVAIEDKLQELIE